MITTAIAITTILVIILHWIAARRNRKIWEYRFFLKILRDCKKDRSLNESLNRICCLFPNFSKIFLIYHSRKQKKCWKNEFRILNRTLREIRKYNGSQN
jgi:hypothetical protein